MRPLLSVCLVTYNQEQYICKVLDGAVSQKTDFEYEIVIGEDYSTDSTRAICQEYADLYPQKVRLLPLADSNLGLNHNFIRTYNACNGKYIAYLEGDDWWIASDKLQKQVDILEQRNDVVLVHTNCKIWDEKADVTTDRLIRFEGECIREKQSGISGVECEFQGHFRHMKTSTCVYRKEVMDDILKEDPFAYNNKAFPTQDFQLFLDMAYRGKFAFVDEDTTVITLSETISVSTNYHKQFRFRKGFHKIGLYYIDKYHLTPSVTQPWLQKEMHYHLNFAMRHREYTDDVIGLLNEDKQHSYRPPLTQQMLVFLLKHKRINTILSPVYNRYYSKRG